MTVAKQARLWQWAAVFYSVCAGLFLAFFPSVTVEGYHFSLLQTMGTAIIPGLAVPVLVSALPALLPWRKALVAWIVAGLLLVFIVATALSVGLMYLPSAAFTAMAAYLHGRAPIEDAPPAPDDWPLRVR